MTTKTRRKALNTTRPSQRVKVEARKLSEGKPARLSVELHPETHRALKVQAAASGQSIKEYVLDLLKREGIPVPE
jgi:predicted HicB family RNase H-like nuclease